MSWRSWALGLIVLVVATAATAAPDVLSVPGGRAAIVRLLGPISEGEDGFVASLNRWLLRRSDPDHKWKEVADRVKVTDYLEDLEVLETRFRPPIDLSLDSKVGKKQFKSLAEFLGYNVKIKGRQIRMIPKEGEGGERRRRLPQALNWDLAEVERVLSAGEKLTLRVPRDDASLPLPAAEWSEMVGSSDATISLKALVQDQRLSYLLEARRRLSHDSLAAVRQVGWHKIYLEASRPFYRYVAALRAEGDRLVVPGGDEAMAAWSQLLETSPENTAQFLSDLLTRKKARPAYLWHSLRFVPDDVARFYLGGGRVGTRGERRFVRKVYRRLDETVRADFDSPRGGDLSFTTFVRAVPLTPDGTALDLPGGPGLWYVAIRNADPASSTEDLHRIVKRGLKKELDEGDFLLKALSEKVDLGDFDRPVLPRLIRAANMFAHNRELLTPQVVVLLARAVDTFPAALDVLDVLDLSSPNSIQQYLLTVAHLDTLPRSIDTEILLLGFQGGIEWLRVMGQAGKAEAAWLEGRFVDWARIHRQASDPFEVASRQLAWIHSMLTGLPKAPPDTPGRGPLERAMLQALVGVSDPQIFTWAGVDYEGHRGLQIRTSLADHMVRQGVPGADALSGIYTELRRLETACQEADLRSAHESAAMIAGYVTSLPEADLSEAIDDRKLKARILSLDRDKILTLMAEITSHRKAKRLPHKLDEVERAERFLAREIRTFLLAPIYLAAMQDLDSLVFEDPNLIRRHLLIESLGEARGSENLWSSAKAQRSDEIAIGSQIRGHLSGVPAALSESALTEGTGRYRSRNRAWFHDYVTARWHLLNPDLTGLVAVLVDAGDEILTRAVEEGGRPGTPCSDFVAARVPRPRLEQRDSGGAQGAGISISERFMLGLAALDGDAMSSQGVPPELSETLLQSFESAIAEAGDGWRQHLDQVAGPTPALNGKTSPWVGYWPPYEAVENEIMGKALFERQMLDLRVKVMRFAGTHDLPGQVAADLMFRVMRDVARETSFEGERDWEGLIRWLDDLDFDYFSERMQECFAQGLYSLRL